VQQGEQALLDKIVYFFYITNRRDLKKVSAAARLSRKAGGLKMDQVFWG
jgi:hypothetical protein